MKRSRFTLKLARNALPIRRANANKTHGGKSLIIAGSKGMWGAAILSSAAAARIGSGYTYVMTDKKQFPTCEHPDFLTINWSLQSNIWPSYKAIAVGPGLGTSTKTLSVIKSLRKAKVPNVVLDADALTVVAKHKLFPLPTSWILTPHTGEMARLLSTTSDKIESDRNKAVALAYKKYQCHILLKGKNTLVYDGKKLLMIDSGNQALAKAGTGDVLTGMITGLLSQGLKPIIAAPLASYVHGYMAKHWLDLGNDYLSLLASDLIEMLPFTLRKIRDS